MAIGGWRRCKYYTGSSNLAIQRSYSAKKSYLVAVAVAVDCSFGWKLSCALPRTMLAQDGAAMEESRSAVRVEVSCCLMPARLEQVFASVVPASLTVLLSTPGEEEAGGPGDGVEW